MSELMAGSYKGHIVDCDSGAVGDNNAPLVKVMFNVEGKTITWTGWFSDKVNQKTSKTYTQLLIEKLVSMGFTGKCVSEMSAPDKVVANLFDTNKEWNLELDYQVDKSGVITKYLEVKWINDPESRGTSKLDHVTAVGIFKGMNLSGMLNQAKKNAPKREVSTEVVEKVMPAHTGNDLTMDDIPF